MEIDLKSEDETKEVDVALNFDVDDDEDLVSNVDEILEGTNPSDPGDCPKKVWYKDADSDGYTEGTTQAACASSSPYNLTSITPLDCDDTDSSIYPGAPLNCSNGKDNDCSGKVEEWFFQDQDSDSWTTSVSQCANIMPSGFTSVYRPTDCDDSNALINPSTEWYIDSDLDGYYGSKITQCSAPANATYTVQVINDCNDSNSSIHPSAPLNCNNNQDNDCSGQMEKWFYQDSDSDSWTTSVSQCANTMPVGFTSVYKPTDCNDSDPYINPSAPDNTCDLVDNNCNLYIDEATAPCFAPSLTISAYGLTQVSLSWTYPEPSSNVENFVVEKSPNGITFTLLKILPRGTTSYTDTTYLVNRYYYRVYARNATGSGSPSFVTYAPYGVTSLFEKTFGGGFGDYANSVTQSSDGGYVVVGGTASFGAGGMDMYIVKIDGLGNIMWTKTVGGINYDYANSVIQSSDGGYVVVGYTGSFGAGSNDIYIVKAGPSFDTCFSQAITNYIVGSGGSVSSPTSSTYPVSPTVQTISPTTGVGGSVTDVCVSFGAPVLPMCYAQGSCEEPIATIPFYYRQSSSDGSGYYRNRSKDSSYGCSVGLGEICIPLLFILYILFKVLPVKGRFKKKMF